MAKVSEASFEGGSVSSIAILRRRKTGPFRVRWKHLSLQIRLTIVFGGGQEYLIR